MQSPDHFALPKGITGFGIDNPPGEVEARRQSFLTWARALAAAIDSPLVELEIDEPWPSFDAVRIERFDQWLLHNRNVPLVGCLGVAPHPGPSWAVAGGYVDIEVPSYAATWGPRLLGAATLNAPVSFAQLATLSASARSQADRYKPETVAHLLFNYWT